MKLLKLVIIDDESILLQGLLKTYDWKEMGFDVVGAAQSGEKGIQVIRETKPHVVLTDIRMKQISGLMVMQEIQKEGLDCLFIVLSAYREFEYAQQACRLGAFRYLLKPIDDHQLQQTMDDAYRTCMEKIQNSVKYKKWEKLVMTDATSFLQMVVQKYLQNQISYEKIAEVFETLDDVIQGTDRFITVCADIDLTYKITNYLDYEAAKFTMEQYLEKTIEKYFFCWHFESEEGYYVFVIKTGKNAAVRELKKVMEQTKKEQKSPVIAAISKPYKGLDGIRRSYEEAKKLFGLACTSGASAFTIPDEIEEKTEKAYSQDAEMLILNAVRKSSEKELKEAFVRFIYNLPQEEELQCQYMHRVMLKVEIMMDNSYGMAEGLKEQFQHYYSNLQNLNAARTVDVCYKILGCAIEERIKSIEQDEGRYFKEYMSAAVAYIEEHLNEEELSIVSVATHIYLNPVYFGRVFKNTFHMSFKKYLTQRRMEKARELLESGMESIGMIGEQVGISNPSYFSHLFKEYTGMLPSEYKKEYES